MNLPPIEKCVCGCTANIETSATGSFRVVCDIREGIYWGCWIGRGFKTKRGAINAWNRFMPAAKGWDVIARNLKPYYHAPTEAKKVRTE